jgi:protein-disulfide isomerase
MNKTTNNVNRKNDRKQQAKQQSQMRKLIWITASFVVLVAIIVAAVLLYKPTSIQIAYDKIPVLGDAKAPIKIVELGDFKCPSCQYFSQEIEPQLKKDFIDKGIASLHFMNFTIIGPDSVTAALAGQAIYHQNQEAFWKFYDVIYKNQQDEKIQWATPDFLTELARKEGLSVDYDKLKQDIVSKTYQNEVDEQNAFARKNQFSSTPTILINGKKFDKVFDYNALKTAIENVQKGGQ